MAAETAALDEIVVTRKSASGIYRPSALQLLHLTVLRCKRLGITDVTAIANQTPGMQFNQYGATITVYNL